jgi:hypothetical protein
MNLSLSKNDFVNYLLNPVSKLADNLLLNFVVDKDKTKAKTLVSSSDNSVIFLGEISCKVAQPIKCVIPDCKTFLRLFSNIETDNISLTIDNNSIRYKENNFSFKYHLLDESYIVNKKSISEDKLNQLNFDTTFVMTKSKFSELIKFNSIVPDAEKLYFYTDNNAVVAKLGDEQKANTNEIVTEIASSFDGSKLTEGIPVNIQNMLLFSFAEDKIEVSVNKDLKVLKFETKSLKYIVSGLVK